MLIEIKRFNSFIDLDIASSNMYVFRVVEESNIVSYQSLPNDDTLVIRSHIWLLGSNITYDLLDCELLFHLKSIAVKGNKLEFFYGLSYRTQAAYSFKSGWRERHCFPTRRFIVKRTEIFDKSICKNFIQLTYKIGVCPLACEKHKMF